MMSAGKRIIGAWLAAMPLPAFAGNWGENWGAMVWGPDASVAAAAPVPVNELVALAALVLVLGIFGARRLRRQ